MGPEQSIQRACKLCGRRLPITEFYAIRNGKYYHRECKACSRKRWAQHYKNDPELQARKRAVSKEWSFCHREQFRSYRRNWATNNVKGVYQRIVRSTKEKSLPPVIPQVRFILWYQSQPRVCTYCGVPEDFKNRVMFRGKKRLSIDRIDPPKGYVDGNLALACYVCNSVKSDILTGPEMQFIGQLIIKPKWNAC